MFFERGPVLSYERVFSISKLNDWEFEPKYRSCEQEDSMSEVASSGATAATVGWRTGRYAGYVFWVLFLVNFLNYLDRYILTGAANVMAREIGFGISGIGYLASAFLIVFTLTVIPLGALADRIKRKNVIAICLVVWSAATA